jgi:hypothetical protein
MDAQHSRVDFGVSKEINEHILAQALENYAKCVKKGMEHNSILSHLKEDLDLTLSEYNELVKRLEDKKTVIGSSEDNITSTGKTTTKPRNECIYFEDAQQSEQAVGMLMYKGVPWLSRGVEDNKHYIQFDDNTNLSKAYNALTRRWDFVNKEPKRVAVIEFDNLTDYEKVIEFMTKQGMVIEFGGEYELEEDTNYRYKKGMPARITKTGKHTRIKHLNIGKSSSPDVLRSLQAKQRQIGDLGTLESIAEEKEKRVCRIRSKWKPDKEA